MKAFKSLFVLSIIYQLSFSQNGVIYSTDESFTMTHSEKMACLCNDPDIRDAFMPSVSTTVKNVGIRFIVLQSSIFGPAVISTEVQSAINNLNVAFMPYKIQLLNQFSIEFITDNKYYKIQYNEQDDLKNKYPRNNEDVLAIYIVKEVKKYKYFAQSTFPWQGISTNATAIADKIATSNLGGIVFEKENFLDYNNVVHEIGHAFGLYHTFHGSGYRETSCTNDPFDVENIGGSDNDIRGDFCSDTQPFTYTKPTKKVCSDGDINNTNQSGATLTDCNGTSISLTEKTNHMSYTGHTCRTQLTVQQAGRMHCFLSHYSIKGWLIDCIYDLPLLNQTTNQNQTYSVSNKIEAGPNYVVSSGTNIKFEAGNKIVLNPGFVAQAGSHFVAEIAPCTPMRLQNPDSNYISISISTIEDEPEAKEINNQINISPNPATGKFTIQLATANWQLASSQKSAASIEIYNTLGEVVYQSLILNPNSLIDLSSHPKGIYFIKIQSGDNRYTEKVVMQ